MSGTKDTSCFRWLRLQKTRNCLPGYCPRLNDCDAVLVNIELFGTKQGIPVSCCRFSVGLISCISKYSTLSKEKILFEVYEYNTLNLTTKLLGVVSPHELDMGNPV